MAVIIVPKFTKADIARMLADRAARIDQAILNVLIRVGEQFVSDARSVNTYQDDTGNLRSSIGYVVLKDGKQLSENFERKGAKRKYGGRKGEDGVSEAKKVINEAKSKITSGYALIVVAGMDYAYAVESGRRKTSTGYSFSVRPKDVLTGSSFPAIENLKKNLFEVSRKISSLK
jgi:hypothetical protein